MSNVAFLFAAVGLSLVGSLAVWLLSRKPSRWDSGIDEFSREMDALAPDPRVERRRWRRVSPGGRSRSKSRTGEG